MKVYVKCLQKIGKHDSTCNRGITSRPSHTIFLLFCFFCLRRPSNPRNACHFLYKRERRSSTFFCFFNSFNLKKSMSIVTAFPGIEITVVYPFWSLLWHRPSYFPPYWVCVAGWSCLVVSRLHGIDAAVQASCSQTSFAFFTFYLW